MNKLLFFFLLIITTGLYIFNVDQKITNKFVFVNNIKKYYTEKLINIEKALNKYFFQVKTIEDLSLENKELIEYKLLYLNNKTELENIKNSYTSLKLDSSKLQLTKILSYVNLDDYTKVWLDLKKEDKKIQGLVSNDSAVGIVINQAGQAQALLNGNPKSNYSVYIGKEKAPGIIHGSSNTNLILAKYIPIWMNIKIGDEVITSGMDDIFFEGLKVGKVVSIKKMADMQEAKIEPHVNVLKMKFFYIYTNEKKTNKKP